MSPRHDNAHQAVPQTIGFCVEGDNRRPAYVWVEADSVEAGRARLGPLFPGCHLELINDDDSTSMS